MENYLKAYIIAEIGSNWEGNLSIAKKIIRECKRIGVDAIKFQMWRASDLYSENHPDWKIIKKSELTFKKAERIKFPFIPDGLELKIAFLTASLAANFPL